jgi:hypothetical protein
MARTRTKPAILAGSIIAPGAFAWRSQIDVHSGHAADIQGPGMLPAAGSSPYDRSDRRHPAHPCGT